MNMNILRVGNWYQESDEEKNTSSQRQNDDRENENKQEREVKRCETKKKKAKWFNRNRMFVVRVTYALICFSGTLCCVVCAPIMCMCSSMCQRSRCMCGFRCDYKDNDFGSIGISMFVLAHTHSQPFHIQLANFFFFFVPRSLFFFCARSCFRRIRDWYIWWCYGDVFSMPFIFSSMKSVAACWMCEIERSDHKFGESKMSWKMAQHYSSSVRAHSAMQNWIIFQL